jgi:hypothetical protein
MKMIEEKKSVRMLKNDNAQVFLENEDMSYLLKDGSVANALIRTLTTSGSSSYSSAFLSKYSAWSLAKLQRY